MFFLGNRIVYDYHKFIVVLMEKKENISENHQTQNSSIVLCNGAGIDSKSEKPSTIYQSR